VATILSSRLASESGMQKKTEIRARYVTRERSLAAAHKTNLNNQETKMSAVFKTARPYAADELNLPVENVDAAIPFYESVMGFRVVARNDSPNKSAILARDDIQIGLAENGGDPTQEGCFFEVDSVEAAFVELKAKGLKQQEANYRIDKYGDKSFKVFFVVAPDGLCYCLGERQA
jgi:catechol 2,3-dioxygenase-like lactoylglutathione lyase family enzyme